MLIFWKIFLVTIVSFCISNSAHAFDLKSLSDKLQKDLGNKLKAPQSGGSNPLGGMLKGLNQNKMNTPNTFAGGNTNLASSNGSQNNAKRLCGRTIPQTLKNLPKGNVADLEKDFGTNLNGIIKILNMMGAQIKFINKRSYKGEKISDIFVKSSKNLKGINF